MSEWKKIELNKSGIYCSFGTYMATGDYSLFITRADGKSLMDYFYKKESLEILNKFIDKNYETFKVNNEENPAYMQKIGKFNFLTKGYYSIDKKITNYFKIK